MSNWRFGLADALIATTIACMAVTLTLVESASYVAALANIVVLFLCCGKPLLNRFRIHSRLVGFPRSITEWFVVAGVLGYLNWLIFWPAAKFVH